MGHTKGNSIVTRLEFVKKRYGDTGYQAVLARLSDEDRRYLEGELILPQTWVALPRYCRLLEAIDRVHGRGDLSLVYEMGRHSAERNLTTIYRLFFRISSVRFVIERAPRLYSMHYDTGELKVATQSENHVLLQLEHVDEPNCAHCASIQGWAAKAIELSGGKLRETTRGRCRRNGATGCEFSFRWD